MLNPPMWAVRIHRSQHFGWLSNITIFKTSYPFYSFAHSFFHIYLLLIGCAAVYKQARKPLGVEPLAGLLLRYVVRPRINIQHTLSKVFCWRLVRMMARHHIVIIYKYDWPPPYFSACAYLLNVGFNQWRVVAILWVVSTPRPCQ